jgi:hypothetical protein
MNRMTAAPAIAADSIVEAVAVVVADPGSPLSAWPDQLPGRWATTADIAERLGCASTQLKYTLSELVAAGALRTADPWPMKLKGYQVAEGERPAGTALPSTPITTREDMLDALRRWAQLHDSKAPSRADWSPARDPERHWPRSDRVAALFEAEACERGIRYFHHTRCPDCKCGPNRHWRIDGGQEFCEGCFDCDGECPHGQQGDWVGPSGWQYALQLAGLQVRTGGDHHATAAQHLGRNRQIVTGGADDVHPQHFRR